MDKRGALARWHQTLWSTERSLAQNKYFVLGSGKVAIIEFNTDDRQYRHGRILSVNETQWAAFAMLGGRVQMNDPLWIDIADIPAFEYRLRFLKGLLQRRDDALDRIRQLENELSGLAKATATE